jgi:CRP-like cAMP-binding protein
MANHKLELRFICIIHPNTHSGEKKSDTLYVISDGRCEIKQNGESTKIASIGDVVGSVDFLNELSRISTATVLSEKLYVYTLNKSDFREIIDKPNHQSNIKDLKNIAILSPLTDGQLRVLEKQIVLKDCVKGKPESQFLLAYLSWVPSYSYGDLESHSRHYNHDDPPPSALA